MFEGKFPASDHHGNALTGSSGAVLADNPLCSTENDYFCVLWSVKGDIDWFSKGIQLRSHGATQPCDYCSATRAGPDGMLPSDVAKAALWKGTLQTRESWRANNAGNMHILFDRLPY